MQACLPLPSMPAALCALRVTFAYIPYNQLSGVAGLPLIWRQVSTPPRLPKAS